MADLAVQRPGVAGVVPTFTAASGGGDAFLNDGKVLIEVVNGGGAPINVTVDDPNSRDPGSATAFNPDVVVAVANASRKIIGPFPTARFNDVNGKVQLAYSGVVTVTVGVFGV